MNSTSVPPPPHCTAHGTQKAQVSWHVGLQRDPLEHLQHGLPNMERLRVTTVNCGGLAKDLRKVPRLIAYFLGGPLRT